MIVAATLAVVTTITIATALLAVYTSAAIDTLPEDAPMPARVICWHGRVFTVLGLLSAGGQPHRAEVMMSSWLRPCRPERPAFRFSTGAGPQMFEFHRDHNSPARRVPDGNR